MRIALYVGVVSVADSLGCWAVQLSRRSGVGGLTLTFPRLFLTSKVPVFNAEQCIYSFARSRPPSFLIHSAVCVARMVESRAA